MIALLIFPLILAYSPAAVWALRAGGPRMLWLLCSLALATIIVLALLVSAIYSVPSAGRVLLYFLAFFGPSILAATGSLTLANLFARALPVQLMASMAGGMIGLAVGFVVVVYGLGVW